MPEHPTPPPTGDSARDGCGCLSCTDAHRAAVPATDPARWVTRMIVCAQCGNKRCPHATHHDHACTGSNEPGQPGSVYRTRPALTLHGPADILPLTACRPRTIYRVSSRNLRVAVYTGNADGGFIGIREKFGDQYLFTENHHDTGPLAGTLFPLQELGEVPADVELREYTPTVCRHCGQPADFDRPVTQGGRGWAHTPLGSAADGSPTGACPQVSPVTSTYRPLFDVLAAATERSGT